MLTPIILHSRVDNYRSNFTVDAFQNVPTIKPCLIVIETCGTPEALIQASELVRSITDSLVLSSPHVRVEHRGSSDEPDPTRSVEFARETREKLLVLIGDSAAAFTHVGWYDSFEQVLPMFQKGTSVTKSLPGPAFERIRRTSASFYSQSTSECVPAVFALVGLTAEDQRIFISYRRIESQPLAEQLFDALTHEGFEVFLDRFSIEPGPDFQRRLHQELAEKAMVLMLESEYLADSRWTQLEIDYCKKYRLGLYSLTLPDAKPIKALAADFRTELTETLFENPGELIQYSIHRGTPEDSEPKWVKQWGNLKQVALRDIILKVKEVHDQALFRRRRYIRQVMEKALSREGASGSYDDAGMLRVRGRTGQWYSMWLTSRPPELPDFHVTHVSAAVPPGYHGVLVGPLSLLEPRTKNRILWLQKVCGLKCMDESQIRVIAKKIAQGVL